MRSVFASSAAGKRCDDGFKELALIYVFPTGKVGQEKRTLLSHRLDTKRIK
jgi:hypothetical protein